MHKSSFFLTLLGCSALFHPLVADDLIAFEKEQTNNTSSTHRTLEFENDQVRAWKTTVLPNQPLKMHRHEHDRVVVMLKGGNLAKLDEDGHVTDRFFETGKSYWLTKDPEGVLHACVNKSNEPIEVVVIEMK